MDRFWYEATFYIRILSLVIALTVAFTWPRRRGKALLCSYLIVSLLAPLPGYVLGVLLRHGTIDWESLPTQTIHAIGAVLSIVIAGLLLVFVIVARRQDRDEMPAFTETGPRIEVDEQTSLYYTSQGQQYGPISPAELREKCAVGQINHLSDLLWFEGAENWIPVTQIEGLFPGSTPPPAPTPPTVGAGGPPPLHQPVHTPIKSASFHLILGLGLGFWCCYIAAIANFVIGVGESRDALVAAGGLLIVVAMGLGVTFVVVCCIYVYRMWTIIQGYTTRATPGIAMGFLFIPFFNLYWIFQAFHGWSKDYNQFVYNTQRADAPSMPEGLFLTFAILCVISAVPYIGLLAFIPQTIVFFIVAYHICRAINHFADRY